MSSSSLSPRSAFFPQGSKGLLARDPLAAVELGEAFLDLAVQPLSPLSIQNFALVEEA
jgi:hypothetical protein